MKPTEPTTSPATTNRQPSMLRKIVRFLGSVQLAVPVLGFVAAAMAWGTYLESSQNSTVSRATVYGAWWFMGLMVLICISLIFAVVNRYPWKRKHIGLITVHAGLVLLIFGSFQSLLGRLEGHLTLEEGSTSDQLETDREVLELAEFNMGKSTVVGTAPAPKISGRATLGDLDVKVVERWENSKELQFVANDAPQPLRAFELSGNPTASEGDWVGEEGKSGSAPTLESMTIRVLSDGVDWTPPVAPAATLSGYVFIAADKQIAVGEIGSEAFPGWKVLSVKKFTNATVSGGKISDGGSEKNPAIDVTIGDGQGTVEQHTTFESFPDMLLVKTLEGSAKSGARLTTLGPTNRSETFVLYGPVAAPKYGYIGPDGGGKVLLSPAALPAIFELGSHRLRVLRQFSNARAATRFVQAPHATDVRPALVVKLPDQAEPVVVAWKGFEPIGGPAGNRVLRFGPEMFQLPFSVNLKDFRKMDYPGTEMAMSYESNVVISEPGNQDIPYLIHMNTPFSHAPWKVYQSGFIGDKISVFSVMRDPGLPLTYLGSIVLCIGIFVTFFSRSMSWGHPGIPAPSILPERRAQHASTTRDVRLQPALQTQLPADVHADRPVRSRDAQPVGTGV